MSWNPSSFPAFTTGINRLSCRHRGDLLQIPVHSQGRGNKSQPPAKEIPPVI
jgi:hypothetical protein